MPRSVESLLQWWEGIRFKKSERKIWKVLSLVALWSIWKYRNECLFNGIQPRSGELKESIIIKLAIWMKASFKDYQYSITDFLLNLAQIRHCLGGRG